MPSAQPLPRYRFFKNDGTSTPRAFGKVTTYFAGTTTPKTTYSDSAGLSANTNPIVLDANGEWVIYLEDGQYDFLVSDSDDSNQVTIYNIGSGANEATTVNVSNISALRDLVPGVYSYAFVNGYYTNGDGGQGYFIWEPLQSLDDNTGTVIKPNSVTASGRWVRSDCYPYIGQIYNIQWFGCTAIGSDITTKLQKVIDTVNSYGNNATILVPSATPRETPSLYYVNSSITIPATVTLKIEEGGALYSNTSFVLTMNGHLDAGRYQILGSPIILVFNDKSAPDTYYPEWWGAVSDDMSFDSAGAWRQLLYSAPNNSVVRVPNGNYRVNKTLYKANGICHLVGIGQSTTDGKSELNVQPSSNKVNFYWGGSDNGIVFQSSNPSYRVISFKNIGVYGSLAGYNDGNHSFAMGTGADCGIEYGQSTVGVNDIKIEDCSFGYFFYSTLSSGIRGGSNGLSAHNALSGGVYPVNISSTTGQGLGASSTHGILTGVINDCEFRHCLDCILIDGQLTINNCTSLYDGSAASSHPGVRTFLYAYKNANVSVNGGLLQTNDAPNAGGFTQDLTGQIVIYKSDYPTVKFDSCVFGGSGRVAGRAFPDSSPSDTTNFDAPWQFINCQYLTGNTSAMIDFTAVTSGGFIMLGGKLGNSIYTDKKVILRSSSTMDIQIENVAYGNAPMQFYHGTSVSGSTGPLTGWPGMTYRKGDRIGFGVNAYFDSSATPGSTNSILYNNISTVSVIQKTTGSITIGAGADYPIAGYPMEGVTYNNGYNTVIVNVVYAQSVITNADMIIATGRIDINDDQVYVTFHNASTGSLTDNFTFTICVIQHGTVA